MPQSGQLIIKEPAFDWDQSPGFQIHFQISRSPSQRDFTAVTGVQRQNEQKQRDGARDGYCAKQRSRDMSVDKICYYLLTTLKQL